jgi:hypothetical protein
MEPGPWRDAAPAVFIMFVMYRLSKNNKISNSFKKKLFLFKMTTIAGPELEPESESEAEQLKVK